MSVDLRAIHLRRQRAIELLKSALAGIDHRAVRDAAEEARRLGIYAPEQIDWQLVEGREAKATVLANFRAALEAGDDRQIGQAYARAVACCPDDIDPESKQKGLVAFRRWGRALRQEADYDRHPHNPSPSSPSRSPTSSSS